jgi:hypothetical protein
MLSYLLNSPTISLPNRGSPLAGIEMRAAPTGSHAPFDSARLWAESQRRTVKPQCLDRRGSPKKLALETAGNFAAPQALLRFMGGSGG